MSTVNTVLTLGVFGVLFAMFIVKMMCKTCTQSQTEGFANGLLSCPTGMSSQTNREGQTMCCQGRVEDGRCLGTNFCTMSENVTKVPKCQASYDFQLESKDSKAKNIMLAPRYVASQFNRGSLLNFDSWKKKSPEGQNTWKSQSIHKQDKEQRIRQRGGDWCLDVLGSKTESGSEVGQYPCNDQQNQKWKIWYTGQIESLQARGKCITVQGPLDTSVNDQLKQYEQTMLVLQDCDYNKYKGQSFNLKPVI